MEQPIKIEDGVMYIKDFYLQDPQAAAILATYPEAKWPEMTRRALKIGLHYLKAGAEN